jgi:LysM repeat protein
MAKYGRNEDNMLAHVAEGELVIPSQFLEDEVIKQRIYDILTEAGVEDPEAYVVGAESNDLNPTTGLPEFFLKKLFKGIVKGIKKVVKGVIKVIKKIAPIVLPIVLAMTPLGPIFGAALGSGIGTLLNGGSIKDALKSALISGAIGGISAGFGAGGGQGSFMENVSEAASGFGARVGQTASGFTEGISSGSFGGFKDSFFADYVPTPGAEVDKAANAFKLSEAGVEIVDPTVVQNAGGSQYIVKQGDTLSEIAQANNTTVDAIAKASNIDPANINNIQIGQELTLSGSTQAGADASRSFLEKTGDVMFRGGKTPEAIAGVQDAAGKEYLTKMAASGIAPTEAGLKAAQAAAGPGLLTRFGPSALAGTAVAAGAGFFDVPEMEQATFLDYNSDGTLVTGRDLIDADPGKYLVKNLGQIQLNEETGEYEPITTDLAIMGEDTVGYVPPEQVAVMPRIDPQQYLTSSTPGGPFARPYVTQGYQSAAEGGPIFPRRNGGIAPNEGTPGEDSVRAMLMPGEFVMTTDAVRGLGNGNLNNGIKNMYSVMRNLESRGRQMA